MNNTVSRGPSFDSGPGSTENLEAQAATTGAPLPVGDASPVSALTVLTDAVAAGRVAADWFDQDNPIVCWYEESCHSAGCEAVCEDCADCDNEPLTLPVDDLSDAAPPNMKKSVAFPFRVRHRARYNDCSSAQGGAARIVAANTAKYVGRDFHRSLAASNPTVLNDGEPVGCFATAFGMIDQAREVHHDGTSWKTIPRLGIANATAEGVVSRSGSRLVDVAGRPIVTGGVPITGPLDANGAPMPAPEGSIWVWGHGPGDYGLTPITSNSDWNAIKNEGIETAARYLFTRVDSCGVYAVPVSLKCGC